MNETNGFNKIERKETMSTIFSIRVRENGKFTRLASVETRADAEKLVIHLNGQKDGCEYFYTEVPAARVLTADQFIAEDQARRDYEAKLRACASQDTAPSPATVWYWPNPAVTTTKCAHVGVGN